MTSRRMRIVGGSLAIAAAAGIGLAAADAALAHEQGSTDRSEAIEQRIDEAVADGRIDEDRAAELRDRADRHAERHAARAETRAAVAEALGLTVDELHAARHDGQTIADLANEAGVDLADIVDLYEAAVLARIEAAVDAGRLDQATADERIEGLREQIEARLTGDLPEGEGPRGRRGRGHHHLRGHHHHGD